MNQRYSEAIDSAQRAATLGPGDAAAHVVLGYVLAASGRYADAAKEIETAMRLNPNLPSTDSLDAGLVFILARNFDRAIATLERAQKEASSVAEIRYLLAAAYGLAGRKDDARVSAAEGLRARPDSNLAAMRHGYSHISDAEALDTIIAVLRQAGVPDWPYGFNPGARAQLTGEEISRLAFGHTWQGYIEGPAQPAAILQISQNGKAAFRSPELLLIGTVHVDHNELCEQSEYFLQSADCGPVFGPSNKAAGTQYTYVNAGIVFNFSVTK
jgi:tetratricopeptide (TPR) repeat protein